MSVVRVILNDKIVQAGQESGKPFILNALSTMRARCIRCKCGIGEGDTFSMLSTYREGTDFPCWILCEPCTKRVIEFAKEGV